MYKIEGNVITPGTATLSLYGNLLVGPTGTTNTYTLPSAGGTLALLSQVGTAPSVQNNGDANATWTAPATILYQTAALTTNRTGILPPAAAYPAGTQIGFVDNYTTTAVTLNFAPQGSDTMLGPGGTALSSCYAIGGGGQGSAFWVTDGVSKWTLIPIAAARITGIPGLPGIIIGATAGGTYNGNVYVSQNDRYPEFAFRAGTTTVAQMLADVNNGPVYFDLPYGINFRSAIGGGSTVFKVSPTSVSTAVPTALGANGVSMTRVRHGVATLAGGTVTVNDANVTANTRLFLTAQDGNTTGALRVSGRTAGTSFAITSSNAADSGVVAYEMIEP